VYYGPSGFGKTTTIVAVANETRAYYVQMRSAWGKKPCWKKSPLKWACARPPPWPPIWI
jgi:hypothetical protein